MIDEIKSRILRHENDRRHADALAQGLSVSITSKSLLSRDDSDRISREGQNAVDEIAQRIVAETGRNPEIEVRYLSPNLDIHDKAWMGL